MQEFIYEAYRGELFGITFFKAFANNAADADEREKWQVLIELESHTAGLLKTWLERHGKDCAEVDPEMEAKGRETAAPWLGLAWQPLMETLAPWVEGYAIKYRQQAERTTAEQYRIFDMTAAHEEAIFSFLQAELAGDDRDSLKAVRTFMSNFPK